MYHYDQVYSYLQILSEVKDLIFHTITARIHPGSVENTGISANALADIFYSQIMALGYNDNDIDASVNDLMPTRNPYFYPGPDVDDAANMAMHLAVATQQFPHQIAAFNTFHKMTQELEPRDEVIMHVERLLHPVL